MSNVRASSFQVQLDSVVTTGLEPDGGSTLVVDLGDLPEDFKLARFLCIQVPREQLRSLGEALIKASERDEEKRGSA